MKKRLYQLLMAVLFVGMLCSLSVTAEAASEKSDGKNMKSVLTYYKKGKYKKANKYAKKLNLYAKEACVKKMSKKMKKAYKKIVKKWPIDRYSSTYLWGYYLTDIDNDKKAELILTIGTCEADARILVYQYKKGKAVKVGETPAGHTALYAYPKHNGIVIMQAHMGGESLSLLTIKKGKLSGKAIGSRTIDYEKGEDYLNLRCMLDDHIDYDSSYNKSIDMSPFK